MKKVEMYISNGKDDHRFIINGETVYEADTIANYVHRPFSTWRTEILQELYECCNDEFCLYLSSDAEQYEYLKNESKAFPKCKDIIWNGMRPGSEESETEKGAGEFGKSCWDELEELYKENGRNLRPTQKVTMGLYIGPDAIEHYVEITESIVSIGFSSGSMSYKCPYFNFVLEEIEDYDLESFKGIVFYLSQDNHAHDSYIVVKDYSHIGTLIRETIENQYVIPLVEACKNRASGSAPLQENPEKSILEIDIPSRIDVGKSQLIGVIGMPKTKALDILSFEMSEKGIIEYDRNRFRLRAVAPGQVEVRVKVKGKIEPIKRVTVEAVEHTYVQSIKLNQDTFTGTVGDVLQIVPQFFPADAENTADVQYESMNSRIAAVSPDGLVELISTGKTSIMVSVGNAETFLSIDSALKITNIIVPAPSLCLGSGESQEFCVYVEPACYNVGSLMVSTDQSGIVAYENGIIRALKPGQAVITFASANSSCKASVQITVIDRMYILARRAMENHNYADASKFYEQIRMDNPDDWEANFFSVYAKTCRTETFDIQRSLETLENTLGTTFDLIWELNTDEARTAAATKILISITQLSVQLAQQASDEHARTQTGRQHLDSRANCAAARHSCAAIDYFSANSVKLFFMDAYPELTNIILSTWKTGIAIDVQTLQYCSSQNKAVLQSDITTVTQYVRQFEPEYNAPRPKYGDTAILDYISMFI